MKNSSGQQIIIFDLGGVLLDEVESNVAHVLPDNLDIERIDGKPPRIFNRMFEFVNLVFNKDCKRDWIIGTISGREIVQKIEESIHDPKFDSFFKNNKERTLIKHGAEYILIPEKLVDLTKLNIEGFTFVQTCKKNGIRILILSNWDPESFALIKNKFSELFALFDTSDIVIPASVGFIKPEQEIFAYLVNALKCNINRTFFIDDSKTNVSAGQQFGLKSIFHNNWHQTEKELQKLGFVL